MTPASDAPSPLARALGRIPTGLYLVTCRDGEAPLGFIGSFVTQVGFEPPTVCVAVGSERGPLSAIREGGRFAISILDGQSRGVMGPFFKSERPFDEVAWESAPGGSPVLTEALAWLECELTGEHPVGDHVVVFGAVTDAALLREGDPSIHLRKNGLGY